MSTNRLQLVWSNTGGLCISCFDRTILWLLKELNLVRSGKKNCLSPDRNIASHTSGAPRVESQAAQILEITIIGWSFTLFCDMFKWWRDQFQTGQLLPQNWQEIQYTKRDMITSPIFLAAANGDGAVVIIGGKPSDNIGFKASDFDE